MPMSDYSLPGSAQEDRLVVTERQLLQTVVEIARYVFGAAASSVFLIDSKTRELVFEAVAGEGASELPGSRFAADTGIAGWVARCGQPMLVDDLEGNDIFAMSAAESTGYVPRQLMAAPLVRRGMCIGVLEVLDPDSHTRGELEGLDLLGLLGTQAAMCLDLLVRARLTEEKAVGTEGAAVLDRVGERLKTADAGTVVVVQKLLAAADVVLAEQGGEFGGRRYTDEPGG